VYITICTDGRDIACQGEGGKVLQPLEQLLLMGAVHGKVCAMEEASQAAHSSTAEQLKN
jgi:hypothetical protein